MNHLSLFSGLGGLDLAAEWAGFTTVGQCEWADYPTKILEKHWPGVPRWHDIRTLTGDDFYEKTGLRTVDIISGGFPCQPFSVAGKRRGTDDDRYLWPEMLRVIHELRPTWVLGENVPGIVNLALDQVLADLENEGYTCQPFNIPACAVDAPHQRKRIFIVGHAEHNGLSAAAFAGGSEKTSNHDEERQDAASEFAGTGQSGNGEDVAYTESARWTLCDGKRTSGQPGFECCGQEDGQLWWAVEPDVGRVANGVPHRVDRLRSLGNAVVRQQAYPFFYYLAKVIQSAGQSL